MKKSNKFLPIAVSAAIATGAIGGGCVFGNDDITVELNGKKIEFDVSPQITEGRTMVPLRKIFEEIGAFVKWDDATKTVSARKNKKTITLTIDSADLIVDKGDVDEAGNPITETVTLETPAQIVSGRTLVPARAVSEAFGFDVDWNEKEKKVVITKEDNDDDSWKENEADINLSELTYKGEGVEITDNLIKITSGGIYTLAGELKNGNIVVSAKEKVRLILDGVSLTSADGPCIFVEDSKEVQIVSQDDSENSLVAENSEDGAIYSKEDMEMKGNGTIVISSPKGHGIKASDNLTIESGALVIDAFNDGIHINDTFLVEDGDITIVSTGDGIDCESILTISGGKLNIKTNGEPIADETPTNTATDGRMQGRMPFESPSVEFEKSSKGMNSVWIMSLSGGEITIDSASHAIHCDDEIEIKGGVYTLRSEYEKGISAHGNLTISDSNTKIDISKSTEGIEGKKTVTINDGNIKINSSDDGINATGGKSGAMMFGGGFGGGENAPQTGEERPIPDGAQMPQGGRPNRGNRMPGGMQNMPQSQTNEDGAVPSAQMPDFEKMTPPDFANGQMTPPDFANGQMTPPDFANGNMPPRNEDRGRVPAGGTENGGMAFPGFGGMGRNMNECLTINGGYIEVVAKDDCLDANGNMSINGGTVKAVKENGAFTGPNSVLDADGKLTVAEGATIVIAGSSGSALNISQNNIIVYCESQHTAQDVISVSDESGNVIAEYTPQAGYRAVLITSPKLETGKTYKINLGSESFEATLSQQNTVVGTQQSGGFGRGGRF